jgi:hypothetical protein
LHHGKSRARNDVVSTFHRSVPAIGADQSA